MPGFSANLGFLWADQTLPDAVQCAAHAGFDAVECHWPYETPATVLRDALNEAGLPLLGLNTRPGDMTAGEFGLSALPHRRPQARAAIDEALDYAKATGACAVHVMAGKAEGPEAAHAFRDALAHACARASDQTILIEPINHFDVPGYFLKDTAQAEQIIADVAAPNLRLMFDCYHVARTEGDVLARLTALLPIIGHIQFASVPDRGAPGQGLLEYGAIFKAIDALGWERPLGAEYRSAGPTEASLNWMRSPEIVGPGPITR